MTKKDQISEITFPTTISNRTINAKQLKIELAREIKRKKTGGKFTSVNRTRKMLRYFNGNRVSVVEIKKKFFHEET
jgi:hypothetical protein